MKNLTKRNGSQTRSARRLSASHLTRRLTRDRRGVVSVVYAMALVPMMVGIGASIDVSRALVVKSRLNAALDAAGLAVGASQGTEAELRTKLQQFFAANYPAERIGVPATPDMVFDGLRIRISATAELDTTLMRVVGINHLNVAGRAGDVGASTERPAAGRSARIDARRAPVGRIEGVVGEPIPAAASPAHLLFGSSDLRAAERFGPAQQADLPGHSAMLG